MKTIFIDFKNARWGETQIDEISTKKEVSEAQLRQLKNGALAIDFSKQKGDLSLIVPPARAQAQDKRVTDLWAQAFLEWALDNSLSFTDRQANLLLRVETYYEKRGEFPPLPQLASADPEFWGQIAKAIEDGELPALPESLASQLVKPKDE